MVFMAGQSSWVSDAQTRGLYFIIMKELYDEYEVDVDIKAMIRSRIFPYLLRRRELSHFEDYLSKVLALFHPLLSLRRFH